MRLLLDEIAAKSLSPNDRLLWGGRGVQITEIHDLMLDPDGHYGEPYLRLDVVTEELHYSGHPRRILLDPEQLVLTLVPAAPERLILPDDETDEERSARRQPCPACGAPNGGGYITPGCPSCVDRKQR